MTELSRSVRDRTDRGLCVVSGDGGVDDDLDLVADLQGTRHRREGLDAELALDEGHGALETAAGGAQVERDRAGLVADRQLSLDVVAVARGRHARRAELDGLTLEDLAVDVLADVLAVLVGQRLDAVVTLADLQRLGVALEEDR